VDAGGEIYMLIILCPVEAGKLLITLVRMGVGK
jgi:hypothetical protein